MRLSLFLLLTVPLSISAQFQDNTQPSMDCNHRDHNNRLVTHCEIREQTVAASRALEIDGNANGGIAVKGWSQPNMLVRAKVEAQAPTDGEARSLASQVLLHNGAGHIRADGPQEVHDRSWSVSYEVFVPHRTDLNLKTVNGGIHIADVGGHLEFSAMNGGLHLQRLAGDVHGETANGGVHMEFAGTRWDGPGVDVHSTNGGVHLSVPPNYSAHLESNTTNGGLHSDFGAVDPAQHQHAVSADIGGGGPTVRVYTTIGGVTIQKAGNE